jgi:DNA-binding HxlR family transcriptional regulator
VPGLSSKVLTERLRLLEESRIIYRDHVPTIPPQVTYGLSERGQELVTALDELFKIAQKWCKEDKPDSPADANPPESGTEPQEADSKSAH